MKTITVKMDETQLRTIITVLEYVRGQAINSGESGFGIDKLCRKDSATRWAAILELLKAQLPQEPKP